MVDNEEKQELSLIEYSLGSWNCDSGILNISDPGYEKLDLKDKNGGFSIKGIINNVSIGTWESSAIIGNFEFWGKRICFLFSCAIDSNLDISSCTNFEEWKTEIFNVGVDSGQAGVFDYYQYPQGDTGEYGDDNNFYDICCKITLSKMAGIVEYNGTLMGVVSSSGLGDGLYKCLTHFNQDGKVDGVLLDFGLLDDEDSDTEDSNTEDSDTKDSNTEDSNTEDSNTEDSNTEDSNTEDGQ